MYLKGKKGSPGVAVKLLPCDHEVMGSSPGNKDCVHKTQPKWSDPAQARATCIGLYVPEREHCQKC
jgi:hypothetical protein